MTESPVTCWRCDTTFIPTWSNANAEAEMKENFGDDTKVEDCGVVCDKCYKDFMQWYQTQKAS